MDRDTSQLLESNLLNVHRKASKNHVLRLSVQRLIPLQDSELHSKAELSAKILRRGSELQESDCFFESGLLRQAVYFPEAHPESFFEFH